MNVKMIDHQRSIMAALGIDIWIPKDHAHLRQINSSLYRDMAVAEATETISFDTLNLQQNTPVQIEKPSNDIVIAKSPQKQINEPNHIDIAKENQKNIKRSLAIVDDIPAVHLDAFYLQAISLENCVIILDATQLSEAQMQLWNNIQKAAAHQYDELKWPFPLAQFQDGRSVQIYIQGFVDALRSDKHVLSLGKLPHIHDLKLIQLANLQEMIDQPLLKRRLWQFMCNKAEQMEVK